MKFEYVIIFVNAEGEKQKQEVIAENFTKALSHFDSDLGANKLVSVIRKSGGILETDIH